MIKDLAEIERCQLKKSKNLLVSTTETKNTQFLNDNCSQTLKISFLSQVCNINKKKILDSKSIIGSKTNFNNIDNDNIIATFLIIDVENL